MPTIRSIASLEYHLNEILKVCREKNEPIFLTDNGKETFVLLSNDQCESLIGRLQVREELYSLLREAEEDPRPRIKYNTTSL